MPSNFRSCRTAAGATWTQHWPRPVRLLYALLAYNDVFGRAAALSPSLWVAPAALMNLTARTKLASGTVLYTEQVPTISQEPDYDAALASLN